MNQMQRIIAKHQHTDGLIALFPQHQMGGNISYDFGPNQGHGTLSNVPSRYSDHSVSPGHFMNASGYDPKLSSNNNILTASLIAAFDGDSGAAFVFCKLDAGWEEGQNRYLLHLKTDANNLIFFRKDTVNDQLYFRHRSGGTGLSLTINPVTTTGWFCMAMGWDRLVEDEVKIYLDGVYDSTGVNPPAWVGDLTLAVIGAETTEPAGVWDGGIGIVAIYNQVLSDEQVLYLSKP